MILLLLVSLIWGFSFGLVKTGFGGTSPEALAFSRLCLAFLVFLPALRLKTVKLSTTRMNLLFIGAIQYGLMYLSLFASFRYLQAYEVALMTIFTPIYIVIIEQLIKLKWDNRMWLSAILAVAGAAVIQGGSDWPEKAQGIFLVQIANLCFALGQVLYRRSYDRWKWKSPFQQYALLFAGASLVTLLVSLWKSSLPEILEFSSNQWFAVFYLGTIASGVSFYLWNIGATKVNAATLAVFNNLKIPIAILISIFVFRESTDWLRLTIGLVVILFGLVISEKSRITKYSER